MNLNKRAGTIILKPKVAWTIISKENRTVKNLYKNYLLKIALIPAFAHIIGYGIFGYHQTNVGFDTSFFVGLKYAVIIYITIVCTTYLSAFIISRLATFFEAEKNMNKAFELVVYSLTPFMVFSIFNISTSMHRIVEFISLYGLYVMYHGFNTMLKVNEEKLITYYVMSFISIITVFLFILKMLTLLIIGNIVDPV